MSAIKPVMFCPLIRVRCSRIKCAFWDQEADKGVGDCVVRNLARNLGKFAEKIVFEKKGR